MVWRGLNPWRKDSSFYLRCPPYAWPRGYSRSHLPQAPWAAVEGIHVCVQSLPTCPLLCSPRVSWRWQSSAWWRGDLADLFLSQKYIFFLLSFGQPWCQLWGKSTVRFKRVKSSELFLKCSVCGWRLKMPQCSAASCPRGVKQRAEVAFWLMAGKGAFSVNETICDRVVCGANFFWFTFPSFLEYTPDYVKWWCAVGCEL